MESAPLKRVSSHNSTPTSPRRLGKKTMGHKRTASDTVPKPAQEALPTLHRRLSLLSPELPSAPLFEEPPLAARNSTGNIRGKRFSVILDHCPFPGMTKADPLFTEGHPIRKSATQLREEINLLETLGMKTSSAVPSELHIFKDKPKTKLLMSTFDLWGPEYAKQAVRAMGCYEAFRTLEGRDRRASLRLDTFQTPKFNSRMADDVSTMKALNTPMMTTATFADVRPSLLTERSKAEPVSKRARALLTILDSCEKLKLENRAMRRTLVPIASTPVMRRKTGLRNSIS